MNISSINYRSAANRTYSPKGSVLEEMVLHARRMKRVPTRESPHSILPERLEAEDAIPVVASLRISEYAHMSNKDHPLQHPCPCRRLQPPHRGPLPVRDLIHRDEEAELKPPPNYRRPIQVENEVPVGEGAGRFGIPGVREGGLEDKMRGPRKDWRRRGRGFWL